ncbi:hypothetical protein BH11MYX3_BH11MYX3_01890 [soil metagenome]
MTNSQPTTLATLGLDELALITGGAAAASSSQAELRQMAQSYCPATYDRFKGAPKITRAMGERCLDEAGYGMFKSRLDPYFPKK